MPKTISKEISLVEIIEKKIYSVYLERDVVIDFYKPNIKSETQNPSVLFINDGQDLKESNFQNILNTLISENKIQPIICIGIYCSKNRRLEYGTSYSADYLGRGNKAGLYAKFILDELIPFVRKELGTPIFKEKSFAGFSLGALSALDIVWNHSSEFHKVGVFSGSLWWRRKAYEDGYNDESDRLMHLQIRNGTFYPWLKFYFQCAEGDETADRNNNGIIDSIDDTLDLIFELKTKGYTNNHIEYKLLDEGKHDVKTWMKALPEFLIWGWRS